MSHFQQFSSSFSLCTRDKQTSLKHGSYTFRENPSYCILGFRVPTTSVGARGDGVKGSKRVRGAKGSDGMLY